MCKQENLWIFINSHSFQLPWHCQFTCNIYCWYNCNRGNLWQGDTLHEECFNIILIFKLVECWMRINEKNKLSALVFALQHVNQFVICSERLSTVWFPVEADCLIDSCTPLFWWRWLVKPVESSLAVKFNVTGWQEEAEKKHVYNSVMFTRWWSLSCNLIL